MCRIKGEYAPAKEIAKIIRGPLRKRWGAKNVRVYVGSGTAGSWVHADVEVAKPFVDCYCSPTGGSYCGRCGERLQDTAAEARRLVLATMQEADAKFSSYYGDMDNDPRDEFLLQVRFITK